MNRPGSYVPPPNIETMSLEQARINLGIQLAALNSFVQNPNSANLQTLTTLSAAYGCVNPPTVPYTVDGENEQWDRFYDAIAAAIEKLRVQAQRAYGPFSIVS